MTTEENVESEVMAEDDIIRILLLLVGGVCWQFGTVCREVFMCNMVSSSIHIIA